MKVGFAFITFLAVSPAFAQQSSGNQTTATQTQTGKQGRSPGGDIGSGSGDIG